VIGGSKRLTCIKQQQQQPDKSLVEKMIKKYEVNKQTKPIIRAKSPKLVVPGNKKSPPRMIKDQPEKDREDFASPKEL